MATLTVPKRAIPALKLIAEHGKSLPALQAVVGAIAPAEQTISRIASDFADRTGIPKSDAQKMVSHLVSLHVVRDTAEITPRQIFNDITNALTDGSLPEASDVSIEQWKAHQSEIEEVLSPNHPLEIVQKTKRLNFEHQNILRTVNILTDIRPVFDDARREVKVFSIGQILELEYDSGEERHQLFLALDVRDVAKLKAACERAETKTVTLKEGLKGLPWPTIVSGEIDDE